MMSTDPSTSTRLLQRPGGAVAFEASGDGPLVVCVPGMGDLRSTYRAVQQPLVEAGHRVALTDLRGHGGSAATFAAYGDEPTAGDIEALIDELGGPAVIVGNSMAAGSAVLVAARRPDLVRGLALIGPFVRDPQTSTISRLMTRILLARPWAAAAWRAYLPKLYAGVRPTDFGDHLAAIDGSIRRPGYAAAFLATTRTSHAAAERALGEVDAPALVMMGELDPDFPDPGAEAAWIADRVGGMVVMVPDAGHYPQSQRPDVVVPALTSFLDGLSGRADHA